MLITDSGAANRFAKKSVKKELVKPEPQAKINIDLLPPLEDVLKSLNLFHLADKFYRMGVVETRILVRLKNMDYQMMEIDWGDSVRSEDIKKLKETVAKIIAQATVTEVEHDIKLDGERSRLTFGRVYISAAVQSFDYIAAAFGGPPPIGLRQIIFAPSKDGCEMYTKTGSTDPLVLTGCIVIVQRGGCSFLTKAQHALAANASVLLIVNNEDRLDMIASGLGIDKNVTDAMVTPVILLILILQKISPRTFSDKTKNIFYIFNQPLIYSWQSSRLLRQRTPL